MNPFRFSTYLLCCLSATAHASWDHPGADRFTGDVPAAVQDYQDIPAATRAKLQRRMAAHQYDDTVTITRTSIVGAGPYTYAPIITSMHFGRGQIMPVASRDKWADDHAEGAMVYTEDGYSIIVPAICGNVARVERLPVPLTPTVQPAGVMGGGGAPPVAWGPVPTLTLTEPTLLPVPVASYMPLPIWWLPPEPSNCCGWTPPVRINPTIPVVPEPGGGLLLGIGVCLLAVVKRRRKS